MLASLKGLWAGAETIEGRKLAKARAAAGVDDIVSGRSGQQLNILAKVKAVTLPATGRADASLTLDDGTGRIEAIVDREEALSLNGAIVEVNGTISEYGGRRQLELGSLKVIAVAPRPR